MNIKNELSIFMKEYDKKDEIIIHLPNVNIDCSKIKAIMINEVVPLHPEDDFYGSRTVSSYLTTTLPLFAEAGYEMRDIQDILEAGIYITNAIKTPKEEYTIPSTTIKEHAMILEEELRYFPNVKVIMLMGDVAKKTFNYIVKKETKKNLIPAISTYKLRNSVFTYKNIRVFPSYIMTGKNILIEKSKFQMASEDIAHMMDIIQTNE